MSRRISNQQELSFEKSPPRTIPKIYDEPRALAARRRRNRQLGALILNQRNDGFLKVDKGLWIPASRGEITVAVQTPELTINKSKINTYERTNHRGYAKKAAYQTRKKIETYYDDAREQRWKLSGALLVSPERSYTEYSLTHSEFAIEAIIRYMQDRNSFIERDWPQKRWSRYGENVAKATTEVKSLYIDDLFDLYDEAMWSTRSRMRFWHLRDMNANGPPKSPPIPFDTVNPDEEIIYE